MGLGSRWGLGKSGSKGMQNEGKGPQKKAHVVEKLALGAVAWVHVLEITVQCLREHRHTRPLGSSSIENSGLPNVKIALNQAMFLWRVSSRLHGGLESEQDSGKNTRAYMLSKNNFLNWKENKGFRVLYCRRNRAVGGVVVAVAMVAYVARVLRDLILTYIL